MTEAEDGARIELILTEYDRDKELYDRFCASVKRLLLELLETSKIKFSDVTSRLKKRDEFEKKIKDSKYKSARDVTDIAGARVITYFEDDIDRVFYLIRDNFEIDIQNSIDKRQTPRPDQFGYQSFHLVTLLTSPRVSLPEYHVFFGLKIEIQIRSVLQHAWAEIEHGLGYKRQSGVPAAIRRRFSRIAGLLELADGEFVAVRNDAGASTSNLPICRAEGITELIPEFSIKFPYSALPTGSDTENKLLTLYTNTNITNQTLEKSANEVRLSVEEGRARVDMAKGIQVGASAVAFANVLPIYPASKGASIKVRVAGLRVNACQLGVGTLTPTTITAALGVFDRDHPVNFELLTEPIDIARIMLSMCFEAVACGPATIALPISLSQSELPKEVVLRLSYRPLTPDPFRPREEERGATELANINGTCLALHVIGVPHDTKVFATMRNLPDANDEASFQLKEANRNARSQAIDRLQAEVSELIVVGNAATAVWNCIRHTEPGKTQSFGLVISIPANADVYSVAVSGSFSPVSVVMTTSTKSPVPRFCISDQLPIRVFVQRPV
jgi:ppGpp synthetase/RelA/SpoT-type nucleotidyltranferase